MATPLLDPETRIVVIGAGVVGAALADDLTRVHGMRSVTVLDQGPLYESGGASSHAPGFAYQTTGSAVMSALATRTLDKLDGATLDGQWVMKRVGGLELASDPERMEYLRRRHDYARSWGIPAEIVGPERCAELFPGLDPAAVLGGFHTPTDGVVKSVRAVEFQARRAIEHGAVFHGLTQVTDIVVDDGAVTGVRVRRVPAVPGNADRGTPLPDGTDVIPADVVVVCTGMWGPRIAERFGLELPMVPMEHCESWTTALPDALALDAETEVERPMLRHQESGLYLRQYGTGYIWGTYEHRVIPVAQDEIAEPEEFARTGIHPAIHPLTPPDMSDTWATVNRLLPPSRELDRLDGMNGIFSFTPDGNPMLGEVAGVAGLWLGLSVWLTQSAGVASVLADWLVTGDPGVDTVALDHKRFDQRHLTHTASLAWAGESRGESYRIAHPRKCSARLRTLSTSPFFLRQQELGAVFVQDRGWERPLWYGDADVRVTGDVTGGWGTFGRSARILEEARAAATGAVLADRSGLRIIEIETPAERLGSLFAWDELPAVDASRTGLLRDAAGGIEGRYTVVRTGPDLALAIGSDALDEFRLARALGSTGRVRDVSDAFTALGVLGAGAAALLTAHGIDVASGVARVHDLAGAPVRVIADAVCSAADALLLFAPQHGLYVWDTLRSGELAPAPTPIGIEALRSLRIVAGRSAFGVDFGARQTSAEAGIGGGRVRPGHRVLVLVRLDEPGDVLAGGEPVTLGGSVVGYVTSAAQDPADGRVRAFALVDQGDALGDAPVTVSFLGHEYPGVIERGALVSA